MRQTTDSSSSRRSTRVALAAALTLAFLALTPISAGAHVAHLESTFGQLSNPIGMAIDQSSGDLYVVENGKFRVDKFDSEGNFLLTFGADVGGPGIDTCTTSLSACAPGTDGTAPGQLHFTEFQSYVAVDNSAGDVYVADTELEGEPQYDMVSKFDSEGHLIASWGDSAQNGAAPDGQLDGSSAPGGPFDMRIAGIAVDGSGHLVVLEYKSGNAGTAFRFAQDGSYVSNFSLPSQTVSGEKAIGANAGGNLFKPNEISTNDGIEELTPEGVDIGTVAFGHFHLTENDIGGPNEIGPPFSLALDQASGDLYETRSTTPGTSDPQKGPRRISRYEFNSSGEVIEPGSPPCPVVPEGGCDPSEVFEVPGFHGRGIAADSASGVVYLAGDKDFTSTGGTIHRYVRVILPDVSTGGATEVQPTTATLHGTVNPVGIEVTDCHFQYGTDTTYGQSAPCAETVGSGSGAVAVHADLAGLDPARLYHFRLVAANADGTTDGEDGTFETPGPPTVLAQAADHQGTTTATLHAAIDPHGFQTTYRFEYGTTTSYGETTASQSAGAGTAFQLVSAPISGLQPHTTYHFRAVATSSQASIDGADLSFTTPAASCSNQARRAEQAAAALALPDCRAYEQVSPPEKLGNSVGLNAIDPGGERALFGILGAGLPEDAAVTVLNYYLAERAPGGWRTVSLNRAPAPGAFPTEAIQFVSPQLDAFGGRLDPVENYGSGRSVSSTQLFLHRPDGSIPTFTIEDFGTGPGNIYPYFKPGLGIEVGSADLSHLVFGSSWALRPGDPLPGAGGGNFIKSVYDLVGLGGPAPELRLVLSELGSSAEGEPLTLCDSRLPGRPNHPVSADGSLLTILAGVERGTSCSQEEILLVHDDTAIHRVSDPLLDEECASPACLQARADAAEASIPPTLIGNTLDGTRVFFASGRRLTDDATQIDVDSGQILNCEELVRLNGCNLYEYDLNRPAGHNLRDLSAGESSGVGPQVHAGIGASEDGSRVYFLAGGVLTDQPNPLGQLPQAGAENLYVTDTESGAAHFIGDLCSAVERSGSLLGVSQCPGIGVDIDRGNSSGLIAEITPDGRFLAFVTYAQLTPDDTNQARDVYRYDAQDETLLRVSAGHDGEDQNGNGGGQDATLSPVRPFTSGSQTGGRLISADGQTIVFETARPLQASAESGQPEAYEWRQGEVSLISGGHSTGLHLQPQVSASGRDLFFETAQGLLPEDADGVVDVYDARVDGGFPPQPPPPPICESPEGCGRSAAPAPAAPSLGSESLRHGPEPVEKPCRRGFLRRHGKCVKVRKHHRHRKASHRRAGAKRGGEK